MQLPKNLPDDSEELKKIVIQIFTQYNQEIIQKESTILSKENEIGKLQHDIEERDRAIMRLKDMFKDLQRMKFGTKSEKLDPSIYYQDLFFNEAELGLHDEENVFESRSDVIEVESHTRKKVGRRPLPDHLERRDEEHDIPEDEKICNCGHRLNEIEPEVSEQIVIIPPTVYVRRNVRKKYTCNHCKGDERTEAGKIVVTAPFKTPQIFPGSNLSVETLVFLLLSKWLDGIPFYRISEILLRNKIEIPRGTMCNWVIGVYLRYREYLSFFPGLLKCGRLIGVDETTYQVHNEEGRENTSVSYLWVFRGGLHDKPIVYYLYRTSRSADFLGDFLKGYNGIIQADGLATYNAHLKENPDIILAGCFAHVRRKFEKVFKVSKEKSAEKILYTIGKLYEVEKRIRNLEYYKKGKFEEIVKIRQRDSKPLMEHLYKLIEEESKNSKKSDGLRIAVNYAIKEWPKINHYLENGELYIDNNYVENAIRPFVVGRKNWLFADVPEGAEASAMFLSILQTFKVNGLNPQNAAMNFFAKLPSCNTQNDAETLFKSIIGWA